MKDSWAKYNNSLSGNTKLRNSLFFIAYLIIVVLLVALIAVENASNSNNLSNNRRQLVDESLDTCSDIDLNVSFNEDKTFNSRELTSKILPGIQFFTYSYNLLQGKPPFDLLLSGNYHQIFKLTFKKNKISTGSKAYRVPDQLDLPALTGICSSQSQTSSFSSATSTGSLYQASKESTQSHSGSASISASGWGFSVSASLSMSLSQSRSSSTSGGLSYAREGKTQAQYTYSQALLYSARVKWNDMIQNCDEIFLPSFLEDIKELETAVNTNGLSASTEKVIQFLGNWGTHVLKLGKLGAHCKQSTYFSGGYSQSSYQRSSESAGAKTEDYGGSISGGGGGLGFSASVSASYEYASSKSYSSGISENGERSESAEYSSETTYCAGEVDITSLCGGMLGTQDQPALVGYLLQPLWELNICSLTVKDSIEKIVNNIINGGLKLCGGIGIPAANFNFWHSGDYLDWLLSDGYGPFWDPTICFDQYELGLVLLTTGKDVSNTLFDVQPYIRKEYQKVKYEEFCVDSENIQISLALQSFNGQSHFGIELANKQINSFTIDFFVAKDESTNIGSAKYLLLCDDIKDKIYSSGYSITQTIGNGATYEYEQDYRTIPVPDTLNCSDSYDYNIRVGFRSVPKYTSALDNQIFITTPQNAIGNTFSFTITANQRIEPLDITYIIHCNNKRILASGTYIFNETDFEYDIRSQEFSGETVKKTIKYNKGDCYNVNIWTGFRGIYNSCSMAIWTEVPGPTSFKLVLAVWQPYNYYTKCRISNNYDDNAVAEIDYIVFCAAQ